MTATTTAQPLTGFGTVSGAPGLPDGFADVFESTLVRVGDVALHTVQGGAGQPLLLVGGWPQNWYVWRHVMPRLAEHFRVVAVDPRGVGRSDKPHGGYDTGTVAAELVALMRTLGHERFALAGHDVGMWIGYALAADHGDAVARLALLDATIPGSRPTSPSSAPRRRTTRCGTSPSTASATVNEQLVRGREHLYFGDQFRQRPRGHCRRPPSASTSKPSRATPKRCVPASTTTGPRTRTSRRTTGASSSRSPCRSSASRGTAARARASAPSSAR